MSRINRRRFLKNSLGSAACVALQPAAGLPAPPPPYTVVWDLDKAFRESTPTRERMCLNGLWRWQPAQSGSEKPPSENWGYFRVPDCWPGDASRGGPPLIFYPSPQWEKLNMSRVTAAWYQREFTIPAEWQGRRIAVSTAYLNSYAAVHIDGSPVGEIRFPAGEIDITSHCRPGEKHLLTLLVVALPLQAVMTSFADSAGAMQVAGEVERRGLCGDVYLEGTPAGARLTDVKVETSVRNWQITFDCAFESLDSDARYSLRAQISDGLAKAAELNSPPFSHHDLVSGRGRSTYAWHPEKVWDTHTPGNQYTVSMSLLDSASRELDTALPVRFGFREFWIDGRDFYLNGTRIHLAAFPLDNAQESALMASYEATRATLQLYKSYGINFVYTHNYGCEPGTHRAFEEILRAADDEGVLVAFSQPHFGQYDWAPPLADSINGYLQHARFYVGVAQNHPSVICYSTSHNALGYAENMNPDMIDGIAVPNDTHRGILAWRALRAEGIIRRLDPSRFVYHHQAGNLGSVFTMNFYANWVPMQEMSDWFEHWATEGVKPVFTCEYSTPFYWDWSMYRGWYKGKRAWGEAVVPWEFCGAEWNAQLLGPSAYRITDAEKANLRWEAEQFRQGRVWKRWDYPYTFTSEAFADIFHVIARHFTENYRAFRTWGNSATSAPWDGYFSRKLHQGSDFQDLQSGFDWEHLQHPGPRPIYLEEKKARELLAYHPSDYAPTPVGEALYRNYRPLLSYLGGKPSAFTSKDHNFLPGETLQKQLIVINNSREEVEADCRWSFRLPHVTSGTSKISLPTGQQRQAGIQLNLPEDLPAGRYDLRASVNFGNGELQEDSFAIDVLPRLPSRQIEAKIALFDPKGETAALLGRMGIHSQTVDAHSDASEFDVLIIGKGALTSDAVGPDVSHLPTGLKVVVFEQTGEVLERRFGFRFAEYGLRQVFGRVPQHPLLDGLQDGHLQNWRGESTTLPPRLSYQLTKQLMDAPAVSWAGIPVSHVWRCGNRGNVASALMEKPACGNFLPILDGGYALQYCSLLEHRVGRGLALFCQTDVTGRSESDPAAEILAANILRYAASWKAGPSRKVIYAGEPAGMAHLGAAGFQPEAFEGGKLSSEHVLVVGPGGRQQIGADAKRVSSWVKNGGRVLAVGLEGEEASAILPFKVATARREHIASYFDPFSPESPFAGVSPAEVHNRCPREIPLVTRGAGVAGDGVLAHAQQGSVVFFQLVPWRFDYAGGQMNIKRTFRKVSCLLARLLGNMQAECASPMPERLMKPPGENERRWLEGLYLDQPEEWDDPYRFFRW